MKDDQGASRRSYGAVPLLVGGGLAVVLAVGAVTGIVAGIANGSAHPAAASASEPTSQEPPRSDGDGDPSPNPSLNPDRDSDRPEGPSAGEEGNEAPPQGDAAPQDTVYVIQRGDTLTALSARFGISVDALARYNAISDANVISETATLRVPGEYPPESWLPAG